MEEGSLLQEALSYMERMRDGRMMDDDDTSHDTLQMDIYELHPQSDRILQLQHLAQLASEFNNHIHQSDFLWHVGYPPVFGIHVSSDKIPHLRAHCRYGDNVGDEWMAIRYMMELSRKYPTLAIDCWDLDVGPILLIEGSEGLPDWLLNADRDSEDSHRFSCWMRNGNFTLIGPTTEALTLASALDCLRTNQMTSTPAKLQTELAATITSDSIRKRQRTALVVPRPVARLLKRAPHLANAAAVAYAKSPVLQQEQHEDWVWTTCPLARTNYAMLRTLSPKETPKMTPELKRIQRTCSNEATPHIRDALELGMHLTAGLDTLLKQQTDISVQEDASSAAGMSPMEQRILLYWTSMDIACGGDGVWLQQAWQMGPKNSPYDISQIMKCPVFCHEHFYPLPISHPATTMQQVVGSELKQNTVQQESFSVPRPDHVDDEDWIHRGDEALEEAMAKRDAIMKQEQTGTLPFASTENIQEQQQQQLDDMLGGFEKFMSGESEVEGVAHPSTSSTKRERPNSVDEPVDINPRIFLNLMHNVLKSTPEELAQNLNGLADDPFFSEADYALMEPGVRVLDYDESSEEMETIMVRCFSVCTCF